MRCVAVNLSYRDRRLTSDLPRGLTIAGYVPRSSCLSIRPQPTRIKIPAWAGCIGQRNIEVENRLLFSVDSKCPKSGGSKTGGNQRSLGFTTSTNHTWCVGANPLTPRFLHRRGPRVRVKTKIRRRLRNSRHRRRPPTGRHSGAGNLKRRLRDGMALRAIKHATNTTLNCCRLCPCL